jgi:hypothetical protein
MRSSGKACGPTTSERSPAAHHVHLKHAITGVQKAQCRRGIGFGLRVDTWDAVGVEVDLYRGGEAGDVGDATATREAHPNQRADAGPGQHQQHHQEQDQPADNSEDATHAKDVARSGYQRKSGSAKANRRDGQRRLVSVPWRSYRRQLSTDFLDRQQETTWQMSRRC